MPTALKKFSLFFFPFFFSTSAYTIIFCSSILLLLQRLFLNLSLSRVRWALNCTAGPSPGVGESWGDDRPHDPSVVPAAGLCVTLPLLSRAADNRTALVCVIIQEKLVDIFTLISYLQSKHIAVFTTEHFTRKPGTVWKQILSSLSFAGKPPHPDNWGWTGELLRPWPKLVLAVLWEGCTVGPVVAPWQLVAEEPFKNSRYFAN